MIVKWEVCKLIMPVCVYPSSLIYVTPSHPGSKLSLLVTPLAGIPEVPVEFRSRYRQSWLTSFSSFLGPFRGRSG
jgi:hypothetical protein